ncbi:MAG: MBL fold metallo-hydrolase [bacterium]|nr:MAG: MBL fold metallo-hydrolase [bacterium]
MSKKNPPVRIFKNLDPVIDKPEYRRLILFLLGRIYRGFTTRNKTCKILSWPEGFAKQKSWLDQNPNSNQATWIGHSTLLVRQGSIYYLTDPMFSEMASPFSFFGPRRYCPPGMDIDALPKISFVLISHNHYDHLDLKSVKRIYERYKPVFFVPEGLSPWFVKQGIDTAKELPWWSDYRIGGLKVTSVPARHFSARTLRDRNRSHWCGWVVSGARKFYYAGDTGYFAGLKDIGKKFGSIDLAALPIGSYDPQWMMKRHHLNPEEALDLFDDVGGRKFVALHWGGFDLTYEPYDEPPIRLEAEAVKRGYDKSKINILRAGATIQW